MGRVLKDYFQSVYQSDVVNYGLDQDEVCDFLSPVVPGATHVGHVDWIITNPPFSLAEKFCHKALAYANFAAIFARLNFLEGQGRLGRLFNDKTLAYVCPFSERVAISRDKTIRRASSATAYAWFVFRHDWGYDPIISFIPPCRADLESDEDWDADDWQDQGV